jgi:uncharacterized repeat protein (TIGR01451 family)
VSCIKNTPALHIVKTGPTSACTGDTITYNIAVSNNSGSPANNVQIKDSLGLGLSYVSGGTFTYPITSIGALGIGATQNYTVKALVNASFGNIINSAFASTGACADSTSVTQCITAINNQTLSIIHSSNNLKPCRGDTIILSLEICNYTQNAIPIIDLETQIPAGYTAIAGIGYSILGNTVNWNNFSLPAATVTNPSCTTMTVKVKVGTSNNTICTQILTGGNTCLNKSSNCFSVNVMNCWPESIPELNDLINFASYPNPASDIIHIDFESKKAGKLEFLNAQGQVLSFVLFEKGVQKINLSTQEFANGLYQYRIQLDRQTVKSDKIVILH